MQSNMQLNNQFKNIYQILEDFLIINNLTNLIMLKFINVIKFYVNKKEFFK